MRRSYLPGPSTCAADPQAAGCAMSFLPQPVPAGANVPAPLALPAVIWVIVDTLWYALPIRTVALAGPVLARPRVRRSLEQACGALPIGIGPRIAAGG